MPGAVNYQAGGDVNPMRFVSPNFQPTYTIDFQVIQSDGSRQIFGISQMGTKNFPGGPGNQTLAAQSGDILGVFQDEAFDEPLLTVNTAITGGQWMISDTDGTGKPWNPAGTGLQFVGAEARQSTLPSAGFPQNIRVRLRIFGGRAV